MAIITVRDVDKSVWKGFKLRAIRENLPLGKALSLALEGWIYPQQRKGKGFLDGGPIDFVGPDVEHLSEQIDEVLYGSTSR